MKQLLRSLFEYTSKYAFSYKSRSRDTTTFEELPQAHVVMFWEHINAVYIAEYEEAGPGINGVEKMFVRVVSMFSTNEFVAAKDGIFKLDKLGNLTPLVA